MRQKELREKVALLKDGQTVWIAGDSFRAVKVENYDKESCCEQCDLDSICRGDVFEVCCAMETVESHHWLLKLAHR